VKDEDRKIFRQELERAGHLPITGSLGNDFSCNKCGGYFFKTLGILYCSKIVLIWNQTVPTCNELIIKDIIE
jgi:hypothetical protein